MAELWPRPKRRQNEVDGDVVVEETVRFKREGKLWAKMGSQRWSEAKAMNQDLHTQEAMARVLGSRNPPTRSNTSHGGQKERDSFAMKKEKREDKNSRNYGRKLLKRNDDFTSLNIEEKI